MSNELETKKPNKKIYLVVLEMKRKGKILTVSEHEIEKETDASIFAHNRRYSKEKHLDTFVSDSDGLYAMIRTTDKTKIDVYKIELMDKTLMNLNREIEKLNGYKESLKKMNF